MSEKNSISILDATEGQSFSIAGGSYRILISGEQTDGSYAVIEMLVPPGGGPNPHAHAEIQETFYVVEGEVEFKTEEGTNLAGKGSFVNIPLGGEVHCFKNKSDQVVKLLCTVVPAGLDSFFQEIGAPVEAGMFLPAMSPTEKEVSRIKAIGEKYGQVFYPPDFLD